MGYKHSKRAKESAPSYLRETTWKCGLRDVGTRESSYLLDWYLTRIVCVTKYMRIPSIYEVNTFSFLPLSLALSLSGAVIRARVGDKSAQERYGQQVETM